MSLVSVVIPTFNRAYCLPRAIDSVLAQTHREIEVVVVDDGSTDGTRELVAERYAGDDRVRYTWQPNAGVSSARNTGLAAARGTFIALLDSDDVWMPWKIELQLACMRAYPDVGMVWTDMEAVGPDGEIFDRRYIRKMYSAYKHFPLARLFTLSAPLAMMAPELAPAMGEQLFHAGCIFSQMIMGNLVHTSTVLLRRERAEKVKGFDERLRYSGEDYDFHLRTCREGPVGFADIATIRYQRGMPDRLTRPEYRVHIATNFLNTIRPYIERSRDEIDLPPRMLRAVMAEAHAWVGEAELDRGNSRGARASFAKSLLQDPRQPRAWLLLGGSCLPHEVMQRVRTVYRGVKRRMAG